MILVTGATGTNGRLVVHALLRAGTPVRAMVQNPMKAADLQRAGAQLVVADFDKPDTLDSAFAGVERSLLLSAVDEHLVEREARFVERASKAGLRHLVKFSAIGAHPAASFTFGRQHGRSERLIMDSGLTFTFIQPNFFMQNLLWSADTIKARGKFDSTLGATPASHVDARDIAGVIAATLTEPVDRHAGRIQASTRRRGARRARPQAPRASCVVLPVLEIAPQLFHDLADVGVEREEHLVVGLHAGNRRVPFRLRDQALAHE